MRSLILVCLLIISYATLQAAERPNVILMMAEDRFKLFSGDAGTTWELYDLLDDPAETKDLSDVHPERIAAMWKKLDAWRASCAADLQQVQP